MGRAARHDWTCPYCAAVNTTLVTVNARDVKLDEAFKFGGKLTCSGCGVVSPVTIIVILPLTLPALEGVMS